MDVNYFILGITMFLFVLSIKKYTDEEVLQEWIENFLDKISPSPAEEEEVVELEEVRDMIFDFVITNRDVFSKVRNDHKFSKVKVNN